MGGQHSSYSALSRYLNADRSASVRAQLDMEVFEAFIMAIYEEAHLKAIINSPPPWKIAYPRLEMSILKKKMTF
jgi:hypothetical protein